MSNNMELILGARDKNYSSTLKKAMSLNDSFMSKLKQGVGLGAYMEIGRKAISSLGRGMSSLVSDIDSTNAAWKSFASNMEMIGRGDEVASVKKELQDFAAATVYTSADMAQTYSQLAAVGTQNTSKLVQGFGMVAAAAENPQQAMKTLSTQATQMAAKPTVAWQDFKLMLEQTPAGISQVAKAMDMTTTELVSAVQEGKVKTEDFFNAIIKAADDQSLQKMAKQYKTVGQAMDGVKATLVNRLAPSWEKINQLGIKTLTGMMGVIAKFDGQGLADSLDAPIAKLETFIDGLSDLPAKFGGIEGMFKAIGAAAAGMALSSAFAGVAPAISAAGKASAGMLIGLEKTLEKVGLLSPALSRLTSQSIMFSRATQLAFAVLGPAVLFAGLLAGLGMLHEMFGTEIDNAISVVKEKGPQIITGLVTSITSRIPTLVQSGAQMLANIMDGITANIPAIIQGGVSIVQSLVQGLISSLPTLLPAAINMVGTLIEGIASALPQLVATGFQLLGSLAMGIAQNMPLIVQHGMQAIGNLIQGIIANLPSILTAAVQIVSSLVAGLLSGVGQIFECGPQFIAALGQGLLSALGTLGGFIGSILKKIVSAFTGGQGEVGASGKATGDSYANSASSGFNKAASAAKTSTQTIASNISSASSQVSSAGASMGSGFSGSLSASMSKATGTTQSAMQQVTGTMQQGASEASASGTATGDNYSSGIQAGASKATTAANTAVTSATSAMRSGYSKAYSAGSYIGQGLANGLASQVSAVRAKAAQLAAAADKAIAAKAKIGSPSKVTIKHGKWIGKGLANGIASEVTDVQKSTAKLVNASFNALKNASPGAYKDVATKQAASLEKSLKKKYSSALKSAQKLITKAAKKDKNTKALGSKLSKKFESAYNKQTEKITAKAAEKIKALGEKYQAQYDEIVSKRTNFYERLSAIDELYAADSYGNIAFFDFKAETANIKKYGENIEKLKNLLPDSFLEEIMAMDKNAGLEYTNALLKKSDAEIRAYGQQYTAYMNEASKIAQNHYAGQFNTLQSQYTAEVKKVQDAMATEMSKVGANVAKGLVKGMSSKNKEVKAAATKLADLISKSIKKKLGIHSPSRVMGQLGEYTGEGLAKGIESTGREVQRAMNMLADISAYSQRDLQAITAGAMLDEQVDYNSQARYEIHVHSEIDGKEIAKATVNDVTELQSKNRTYENRRRGIR